MNSRGHASSGGLRLGMRGSNSISRGSRAPLLGPPRGGPPRGGPRGGQPRGGPPRGGLLGRGGYQRIERPQYDDYGYNDGYQGGYGRGPQGGLLPPPSQPNSHEWEMEREMILAQHRMLGEQQARLDRQAKQLQHTYTALGPEQRGFKRPAYQPVPFGPPHPKRFPPAPPAFRAPAPPFVPPFPRGALLASPPRPNPARPNPPRPTNRTHHIFRGPDDVPGALKSCIDACVGAVVREMRIHLYAHPRPPPGNWQFKKIRRVIRDRIHALLMNKSVGSKEELLAMYRARHPKRDDEAFVKGVRESMDEDGLAQYMDEKLGAVLMETLEDMFTKISKLYDGELKQTALEVPKDIEMSDASATANKAETPEQDTVREVARSENGDVKKDAVEKNTISLDNVKEPEKDVDEQCLRDMLDKLLQDRLPKVLPQFKNSMIEIMCKGGRFTYNVEEVEEVEMKNGEDSHENGDGDATEVQDPSDATGERDKKNDATGESDKKNDATGESEKTNDAAEDLDKKNDADEMEELLTLIKDTTEAGDTTDEVTVNEDKLKEKVEKEKMEVTVEKVKVDEKAPKVAKAKGTATPSRVNTRRSSRLPIN